MSSSILGGSAKPSFPQGALHRVLSVQSGGIGLRPWPTSNYHVVLLRWVRVVVGAPHFFPCLQVVVVLQQVFQLIQKVLSKWLNDAQVVEVSPGRCHGPPWRPCSEVEQEEGAAAPPKLVMTWRKLRGGLLPRRRKDALGMTFRMSRYCRKRWSQGLCCWG